VCPEGLQELPHNFVAACRDASAGEHDLGSRRVRGVQGAREGGRVVDDTMLIGQEGTGGPHRCGERGAVGVVDLAGSQRFTGGGQFASCRDHRDTNLRANGDGVQSGGCECREVAGSEPEAGRQ
jgi:hypothetical protein